MTEQEIARLLEENAAYKMALRLANKNCLRLAERVADQAECLSRIAEKRGEREKPSAN